MATTFASTPPRCSGLSWSATAGRCSGSSSERAPSWWWPNARRGALRTGLRAMPEAALYLCYFGLGEPLVQTQVLPFLRELAADGMDVSLLTFEPGRASAESRRAEKASLAGEGIRWHALPHHRRPSLPATLSDVAAR